MESGQNYIRESASVIQNFAAVGQNAFCRDGQGLFTNTLIFPLKLNCFNGGQRKSGGPTKRSMLSAFCHSVLLQKSSQLRPLILHISSRIPQLIYRSRLNVRGAWADGVTTGFPSTKENDNYYPAAFAERRGNGNGAAADESPEQRRRFSPLMKLTSAGDEWQGAALETEGEVGEGPKCDAASHVSTDIFFNRDI